MSDNLPAVPGADGTREDENTKALPQLWKPGQSGNPAGRKAGSKNYITKLKQELEIAVRDNLHPKVIGEILNAMAKRALDGNVGAAKLILDKTISNARESEEDLGGATSYIFKITNLTIKNEDPSKAPVVIDITPTPSKETPDVNRSKRVKSKS